MRIRARLLRLASRRGLPLWDIEWGVPLCSSVPRRAKRKQDWARYTGSKLGIRSNSCGRLVALDAREDHVGRRKSCGRSFR